MSDGTGGASPLDEQIDDVRAVLDAVGSEQPGADRRLRGLRDGDAVRRLAPGRSSARSCSTRRWRGSSGPRTTRGRRRADERAARLSRSSRRWGRGDARRLLRPERVERRAACGAGGRARAALDGAERRGSSLRRRSARSTSATCCRASSARRSSCGARATADRRAPLALRRRSHPGRALCGLPGDDNCLGVGDFDAPLRRDPALPHRASRGRQQPSARSRRCSSRTSSARPSAPRSSATSAGGRCSTATTGSCASRSSSHRGRLVKSLGDGGLALFDAPEPRDRAARRDPRRRSRSRARDPRRAPHRRVRAAQRRRRRDRGPHRRSRQRARRRRRDPRQRHGSRPRRRLGLRLADRGERELKGVPGAWRTYAVED